MDHFITDCKLSGVGSAALKDGMRISGSVALEDSIMKKGSLAAAGSKILEGFIAPFDAEVVKRLQDAGINISGKTRMEEFGIPNLFQDGKADEAGLSGAVKAVLEEDAACCLCNDLFGRYRMQAAENGLCYIHPTYGTVSRYGLIPVASSMDQIGVLCKDLANGFALLGVIAGNDPKDGAMFTEKTFSYQARQAQAQQKQTAQEQAEQDVLTIGVPSHMMERAHARTQEAIKAFIQSFASVACTIDHFDVCRQAMYILSCAEISNNINRYDGVKFGYRSPDSSNLESLYTKTRTQGFGLETKLAAIMGAMVLSADHYAPYYEKAMKIRRLIHAGLDFGQYDVMILPASIGDSPYENLSLYAISALAGLPSVSFSYQGCGIQMIARAKNENALLRAWEAAKK